MISPSKRLTPEDRKTLGPPSRHPTAGFPLQLTPSDLTGKALTGKDFPDPAVGFHKDAPSLKKIFNNEVDIYVKPDGYFTTKFREIFQQTKLTHHSTKESHQWLAGPNMKYWPQQLNFATWCATTGCGISRDIFDKDHSWCEPCTYSMFISQPGVFCFNSAGYKK